MTPLLPPDLDIFPTAYVIMHRTQMCICCHHVHHWSDLYARLNLRPRMGVGKAVTNLRAITWPTRLWNIPIEHTEIAVTEVPFCHACHAPSLSHYERPPAPREVVSGPQAPIERTKRNLGTDESHHKPPNGRRKGATLDELESLL